MKKIIKMILLTSMFSASVAIAKTDRHIQKNFLMPRDQISNLAIQNSNWHLFYNAKPDGRYSGTLQLTPFYQKSTSKGSVGKYFGFKNDLNPGLPIEQNYIGAANGNDYLLQPGDVIHNQTSDDGAGDLVGRFGFEPYQEIFGARIDWHQDLDELINGLFFEIHTPIVSVKNNMNLSDMGNQTSVNPPTATPPNRPVTFRDYFIGEVSNFDPQNIQEALKYSRMGGSGTTGGFADIEIDLGYQLFYQKNFRLSFNGNVLIPTGNHPKAVNRFEPIYGSAGHWAIGGGIDTDLTLWKTENKHIKFLLIGDYKFYFKGPEKRTPTFKDKDGKSKLEYIYLLGGEKGQSKVFPLANVLAQDLNIEPGNQVELLAAFNFKLKSWNLDIGYNLFSRESDAVEFKHTWNNFRYAVAKYDYNTTVNFDPLNTDPADNFGVRPGFEAITDANIDLNSVKQPSQTTHKIYSGLGYECDRWKYPVMFDLGGSYEWASTNAALENWAIWLKGSLAY